MHSPNLNLKERKPRSPNKIWEFKQRIVSPFTTGRRKIFSSKAVALGDQIETNDLIHNYVTTFTEEQSIINDKVKLRVLEARMARFSGFKSPRILFNKLIDNQSNTNKYDFDVISPTIKLDELRTKEKYEKSQSFKFDCQGISNLSL